MPKRSLLIILIFACVIVILVWAYFFFSSPRSVEYFYTLKIGNKAPRQIQTEIKELNNTIFTGSQFYVYVIQKDVDWCVVSNCGMSGALVECMGGWFAGEVSPEEYGLTKDEVDAGKSVIVVADKDQRIVGIYPNYTIQNVPYILKNHRNLSDKFDFCYDTQMPKRRGL